MTRIVVSISADVDMDVDEVWPDGDAPDVINADVVAELMSSLGTKAQVLRDWCLLDALDVEVAVFAQNPAWHGDDVLIGEPPPRTLRSYAYPWSGRPIGRQEGAMCGGESRSVQECSSSDSAGPRDGRSVLANLDHPANDLLR